MIEFGRATTATYMAAVRELKKRGYLLEESYIARTGSRYKEMYRGDLHVKLRSSNHHDVWYHGVEISFDDNVDYLEIDLSASGLKIADIRRILDFVENYDTSSIKNIEDVASLDVCDSVKEAIVEQIKFKERLKKWKDTH